MERKLGIDPSNPSGSTEPVAGKKHRLDDTEFLNEHQEIVENVKSAVAAGLSFMCWFIISILINQCLGLMKKKKKAKISPPPTTTESAAKAVADAVSSATAAASSAASTVSEKVLNAPETAVVAAVASAAAGIAAA